MYLSRFAQIHYTIQYHIGKTNMIAYALSCTLEATVAKYLMLIVPNSPPQIHEEKVSITPKIYREIVFRHH